MVMTTTIWDSTIIPLKTYHATCSLIVIIHRSRCSCLPIFATPIYTRACTHWANCIDAADLDTDGRRPLISHLDYHLPAPLLGSANMSDGKKSPHSGYIKTLLCEQWWFWGERSLPAALALGPEYLIIYIFIVMWISYNKIQWCIG